MSLAGKVALVAGVGPGLGNELVLALARAGADVAFGARTQANLDALASEVEAIGRRAVPVRTDITDDEACRGLVDKGVGELGHLDIVVHNARAQRPYRRIEEDDFDDWRHTFEVNLYGPLHVTQAAVPHLRARGGGSVIFVNSMIVQKPLPTMGGYASSKAALLTAAQVLALELGRDRIRVNSLSPGYMDGPSLEAYFERRAAAKGISVEEARAETEERTALGILTTSQDCANTAVFLASDAARTITGQNISVNAGEVFG